MTIGKVVVLSESAMIRAPNSLIVVRLAGDVSASRSAALPDGFEVSRGLIGKIST